MSRSEFLPVFNRLCVALREPQDDSGVTQATYFEALNDLSVEALTAGATALMRESGRKFFPTTAEWRTAAKDAHREHLRLVLPPGRTEPWRNECESCEDSGWVQHLACDGSSICGRARKHLPHDFTKVCGCRATNRTYQRNRAKLSTA